VLDAAARLFAERGVDGVTTRDVATAADVHRALIGRYIGDRESLMRQVFEDLSTRLAHDVMENPLASHGFTPGTLMWTWSRVACALVLSGRSLTGLSDFNPVQAMAATLQDAYGIDHRSARLRASQIVAAAIGWRVFEAYLVEAGELDDLPLETVREELAKSARRLGATAWPSPPDPEFGSDDERSTRVPQGIGRSPRAGAGPGSN
jgi:AcrR family transcriptional regulator